MGPFASFWTNCDAVCPDLLGRADFFSLFMHMQPRHTGVAARADTGSIV